MKVDIAKHIRETGIIELEGLNYNEVATYLICTEEGRKSPCGNPSTVRKNGIRLIHWASAGFHTTYAAYGRSQKLVKIQVMGNVRLTELPEYRGIINR